MGLAPTVGSAQTLGVKEKQLKDIRDIVEYVFGQHNPWAIALVVLCSAISMLKVIAL